MRRETGTGVQVLAFVIPGSSVHGILQARRLEWVAIPFSRGSSPSRDSLPSKPFVIPAYPAVLT